ncbi:MAG: TlpA disulfide reductase family protein [Chloroflexota bacterium]|nr:TlpA disulfide reductase family protein [Chloroflexota bacterium]
MAKSTTAKPPANRPAPALIVLLALPLLGLAVAAALILNDARAAAAPPTPAAVTAPPLQSLPNLVDAQVIDFTLPSLNGGQIALNSYRGRPIFLNFWATWCEPCQRELPAFQAFTAEQAVLEDGAVVLAVNLGETREAVQTYLRSVGVNNIPVLLDENGDVSDQYGVFNLPVTFVIDRDGYVRQPHYGEMTTADLAAYLEGL